MDELIRKIIRDAKAANDNAAWERITAALQRQYLNIKGEWVWIVKYDHRHGADYGVYLSPEEAYLGVSKLLQEYWAEGMGGQSDIPTNIEEALDTYNNSNDIGETIDIIESKVL